MDRKGDLSINYIVMIAIALVVLVVIILFFTGALKTMFSKVEIYSNVDSTTKQIWTNQCDLACQSGRQNYCTTYFQVDKNAYKKVDEFYVCNKDEFTVKKATEAAGYNFIDVNTISIEEPLIGPPEEGADIPVKGLSALCPSVTDCNY